MPPPPEFDIDLLSFNKDPYPTLKLMRRSSPISFVPSLSSVLITKRNDIFELEKLVDIFSSEQPDGLMTKLMGQNLMRKDGIEHKKERKAIFPSVSPKTVQNVWKNIFQQETDRVINRIANLRLIDIVQDFAKPVSAEALKAITGLTNMAWEEMDRVSQGMIDGCANYIGDPKIQARCNNCTESIDWHITKRITQGLDDKDFSLLAVQKRFGLKENQIRANIKLVISGGQNEPRDAIAGIVWALLSHKKILAELRNGTINQLQVFEEYCRWISPIGMSPRRITRKFQYKDVVFQPEDRVFFMFSSGNRDEEIFPHPEKFMPERNTSKAVTFGAGPHFCAGAWASKCLIADVAIPMLLKAFPNLFLNGRVNFSGWAFRGPLQVPVCLW